jgi:hypothetical protein
MTSLTAEDELVLVEVVGWVGVAKRMPSCVGAREVYFSPTDALDIVKSEFLE